MHQLKLPVQHHQKEFEPRVSTETRRILKSVGYKVQRKTKNKYRHLKFRVKTSGRPKSPLQTIHVSLDYACMQHYGIVRHFFKLHHGIDIMMLELLLFLYPIGLFTRQDYNIFPHRYSTRKISTLVKKGVIERVFDDVGNKSFRQVFRLTREYKGLVRNFYEYMHQERELPEITQYNKMFAVSASDITHKKARAICKLNKIIRGDERVRSTDTVAFRKLMKEMARRKRLRTPDQLKRGIELAAEKKKSEIIRAIKERKIAQYKLEGVI